MTYKILSFNEFDESSDFDIGGKARNLFLLKNNGINVPEWIVIPCETINSLIPEQLKLNGKHQEIREFIETIEFPSEFITVLFDSLPPENNHFAVRSSASDEDGASNSFAGQFQSYLYVKKESILEKIKLVWLSAFTERVVNYRVQSGLPQKQNIAIIIQKMINAEVAGVGFGMNPSTGNRKSKIISSVFGQGEGLVSGELDADTFEIVNGKLESKITKKTHFFKIKGNDEGIEKQKLEFGKQNLASLNSKQISEIEDILDTLFNITGRYQDIEFAIEKDQLYLLQTRPITGLNKTSDPEGDYIVWDNSNIVESYPGVTTPLTFSFIIKIYEAAYKQFSGIMGISEKDIEMHAPVYANMLGLIDGRVYYNLKNWYKILSLLPGYSLNAPFMEKMMGVKERFELKDYKPRKGYIEKIRIANTIAKTLKNLFTLKKQSTIFLSDLNTVLTKYRKINFNECRAEELMNYYYDFEKTLLKKWKAPLVNDFFAMIYFGVLQKIIASMNISENPNIHNDLLCGSNDIISTEPIKRCLNISSQIYKIPEAKHLFNNNSEDIIWETLKTNTFKEIKESIDAYIDKFGDRSVGELKLESITYRQNPLLLIRVIKEYVSQNVNSLTFKTDLENELRSKAEKTIEKYLSGKFVKKRLFNNVLRKTRQLVSNRENLRFERTKAFGIVREIFLAIGKTFYREGIINEAGDIFYLKKEEIFDFISGTSPDVNLIKLIEIRKVEFSTFKKKPIPSERIKTFGIVYHGNNFIQEIKADIKGDIKGLGCSPGRVKGRIRVVKDVSEINNMNGDILVTTSTDPGWVNLFPTASAILVERGSLLSHAAIVAREMGIPCIVGISGLLQRVKTGDEIEMDGSTGEIKLSSF